MAKTVTGTDKKKQNLKPFKKGESGNPNGRPKGQRNYATIYREALKKIAEANDKTPEEIEEMMHQVGLNKALKGDYAFYRDINDRLHGKAPQPIGNVDGETLVVTFDHAFTSTPAKDSKEQS